MNKTLGLDLGTNSIGWAVVEKSKNEEIEKYNLNNEKFRLLNKGVHIFTEGIKKEKGKEKSKASERTTYRSARRLKFRRKLRKYETLLVLAKNNMCPLSVQEVETWRKSGFKKYPKNQVFLNWLKTDDKTDYTPYHLRDLASKSKIKDMHKLGRAFYHIAQRRGFLSNRLDQTDEGIIERYKTTIKLFIEKAETYEELLQNINNFFKQFEIFDKKDKDLDAGEQKLKRLYNAFKNIYKNEEKNFDTIKSELNNRLNQKENLSPVKESIVDLNKKIEDSNCETLGQYFKKLYENNRHNPENKIRNNYTAREKHYLNEFERICEVQELEGIIDSPMKYYGIVKDLYNAIFYQRTLKSQKGVVGKCSFEKNKHRCPVSHPKFEEYRMWCFINNIKIKTSQEDKMRFLNKEEVGRILSKFFRKSKAYFYFEDIAKELGEDNIFNFKNNTSVSGCPTITAITSIFNINHIDWEGKIYSIYKIKCKKNRKEKSKEEVINEIWHSLFSFSSEEKLKIFGEKALGLNENDALKFSQIKLKQDYAALSLKAINKILPYLKKRLIFSHAVFMGNLSNIVDFNIWKNKQNQIQNSIKNIIDKHTIENKHYLLVNKILKECKEQNYNYSRISEDFYKKDIEDKLQKLYGEKTWEKKNDKDKIFNDIFELFKKQFRKKSGCGEFIKIKRLDEKIVDYLKGNNETGEVLCTNETKLKLLYHPSDIELFKKSKRNEDGKYYLGSPIVPAIKNPVVTRTMHQLKRLINALIEDNIIDENTTIQIEMARELNDANKRKAIEKYQNERKEIIRSYIEKIKELYSKSTGEDIEPTGDDILKFQLWTEQDKTGKLLVTKEDILKYKLWDEQNHICLYSGKTIGIADFIGPDPKFDIEHTLPRSKSIDNSQMNKTICCKEYNRKIKKNQIPYNLSTDYNKILHRIEHWKEKYEKLDDRIKQLYNKTKTADTKEKKDLIIQERHYLTFHRDYWKGKYERFTMKEIPEGFKNSQIIDIGVITKYAREYLKSVFQNVYTVKGSIVDEFRKSWGLHDNKDLLEDNAYEKKFRGNHIHHCIDAITIACMTRNKYDILANAWKELEENKKNNAKVLIGKAKPWETFTENMKELHEEVLVTHYKPNNIKKQTKKKLRKGGVIKPSIIYKKDNEGNYLLDEKRRRIISEYIYEKDKNGNRIPVFGKKISIDEIENLKLKNGEDYFVFDSTRENKKYYRYVKDKDGNIVYKKMPMFEKGDTARGVLHNETFYGEINNPHSKQNEYVIRKNLKDLKKAEVKKIIDPNVQEIIKKAISEERLRITSNDQQENKIIDKIWRNEEKLIEIKKVRIAATIKHPIKKFKRHRDESKKYNHEYKKWYHVANEENYCMAIYKGVDKKGKVKRTSELINMLNASEYYKISNKSYRKQYNIVPEKCSKTDYPLKYIITKGTMVLLYDKSPNEIWELNDKEKLTRLFEITQLDTEDSGIKLLFHQEARQKKELTEVMGLKSGMKGGKNIGKHKEFPWIKIGPNGFDALVEGYDFRITITGRIVKDNHRSNA